MDLQQTRIHFLHLERDRGEYPQHAHPADHGAEQVAVLFRTAGDPCAGGQQRSELEHMVADGAHLEVVFSVDVHPQAAAQGGGHRAGNDGRPPAIRQDDLPEFRERDSRLGGHHPCFGIPLEDLVHPLQVEHHAEAVEGSIVVTASRTAKSDGQSVLFGNVQGFKDFVRADGVVEECRGTH